MCAINLDTILRTVHKICILIMLLKIIGDGGVIVTIIGVEGVMITITGIEEAMVTITKAEAIMIITVGFPMAEDSLEVTGEEVITIMYQVRI